MQPPCSLANKSGPFWSQSEWPRPWPGQREGRDREAQPIDWPGQEGRRGSWTCPIPFLGYLLLAGAGWLQPGSWTTGWKIQRFHFSPFAGAGNAVCSLYKIISCTQLVLAKCNMGTVFCGCRKPKATPLSFRRCFPLWLLEVWKRSWQWSHFPESWAAEGSDRDLLFPESNHSDSEKIKRELW